MQNTNWMDRQRHALAAYEYLCHVGEAQQWIEGCLDEELGFGVTEMEEGLRDGVVLARLAKVYEGDSVKIWTVSNRSFGTYADFSRKPNIALDNLIISTFSYRSSETLACLKYLFTKVQ
jgi:hypothetical protein